MIVQRAGIKIRGEKKEKKKREKPNWYRNENPNKLAHGYSSLFNALSFLS